MTTVTVIGLLIVAFLGWCVARASGLAERHAELMEQLERETRMQ